MDNIEDLELKKNAVDNYNVFSAGQKKLLKILLEINEPVPMDIIQKIANVSRQSFNFSIQGLLKLGFVSRNKQRVYIYQIEHERLKPVIEVYKKQKKLEKNS